MGVFANAFTTAVSRSRSDSARKDVRLGGLAGWLLERVKPSRRVQRRLALVEKISLAPRQNLALVEVDGQTILIATAHESSPSFCLLNAGGRKVRELRDEVPLRGTIG